MVEVLEENVPKANSRVAFSDRLDDLTAALSLLFIRNNASGRNKFREKWPEVALYLFGEDLIRYDNEGATEFEHREHRTKLEEEAGLRRIDLKRTIAELEDKSVKAGALEFDYVGSVIDKYGAGISVLLYAENIIERVRPGVISRKKADQESAREVLQREEMRKESETRQRATQIVTSSHSVEADVPVSSSVLENVFDIDDDKSLHAQEKEFLKNPLSEPSLDKPAVSDIRLGADIGNLDEVRPIETPLPQVQMEMSTIDDSAASADQLPYFKKGGFVSVFNARATYARMA